MNSICAPAATQLEAQKRKVLNTAYALVGDCHVFRERVSTAAAVFVVTPVVESLVARKVRPGSLSFFMRSLCKAMRASRLRRPRCAGCCSKLAA